jgi:hypothetical protein
MSPMSLLLASKSFFSGTAIPFVVAALVVASAAVITPSAGAAEPSVTVHDQADHWGSTEPLRTVRVVESEPGDSGAESQPDTAPPPPGAGEMGDCMMWGVWCYVEQSFVGETFVSEQAAIEAAAAHQKDKDHKAAARCAVPWPKPASGESESSGESPAAEGGTVSGIVPVSTDTLPDTRLANADDPDQPDGERGGGDVESQVPFTAKGTHTCYKAGTSFYPTCKVERGGFNNCDQARATLQAMDCCPQNHEGTYSYSFSMDTCGV